MLGGLLDAGVFRVESLDVDLARPAAPAGAAGNLGQKLKGALGGTEVLEGSMRCLH